MERIFFRLKKNDVGYPPADFEVLLGVPVGDNLFKINDLPMFVNEIALNDCVEAQEEDGRLWFIRRISPSGHALFRLVFFQKNHIDSVRKELMQLSCTSELSKGGNLLSVDVPPAVDYDEIIWRMIDLKDLDICEIEEACLPREK